tara:strand:+ start:7942 stop:9825 length:1884 start_codon:yes stop_codon:yes gene_type:complete
MADFFYRQASISLPTGGRIRNNAYVTIKSLTGNFTLPVDSDKFSAAYDPNGTGRPAPTLGDVEVSLEGEAGSLRRLTAAFTCYDLPSFEAAEAALLVPMSEVEVTYGYAGPESPSGTGSHKFRVYDYSFKITKQNYFECSFKAVGKGGTYKKLNVNAQNKFPDKEFVTNYNWGNDTSKVNNLFDYLDFLVQKATDSLSSSGFEPDHGTSGKLSPLDGHFGVLIAPDAYEPPTKLKTGITSRDRIIYISLGAVVSAVNKKLLKNNKDADGKADPYKLEWDDKFAGITTKFKSGNIWSPDPVEMIFKYKSAGKKENHYHADERETKAKEYISCAAMTGAGSVDEGSTGSPWNILLGRDLLKAIQQSFADEAKTDKDSVEDKDKVDGTIPVSRFFNKIFASIKENTGGAWDFYLDQDEEGVDAGTIFIVNRKAPSTGRVTPLKLDPVGGVGSAPDNGIRELNLEASVPSEMQAKAFGGAPGQTSDSETAVNRIREKEDKPDEDPPQSVREQQKNARDKLNDDGYSSNGVSSAKAAIKSLVTEKMSAADRVKKGQTADGNEPEKVPYPITFSVVLDGIEGFKFGDTISSSYLPSRYTKSSMGNPVFTVTSYVHKISNNDWTTTVKALMRMR